MKPLFQLKAWSVHSVNLRSTVGPGTAHEAFGRLEWLSSLINFRSVFEGCRFRFEVRGHTSQPLRYWVMYVEPLLHWVVTHWVQTMKTPVHCSIFVFVYRGALDYLFLNVAVCLILACLGEWLRCAASLSHAGNCKPQEPFVLQINKHLDEPNYWCRPGS